MTVHPPARESEPALPSASAGASELAPSHRLLDGLHTVVVAHAHPDDETLATGALLAELAATGRDVHVVTATRGERGELRPGVAEVEPGSPDYAEHREGELARALEALGVRRDVYLGTPPARAPQGASPRRYRDSGMRWVTPTVAGPAQDSGPESFTAAGVLEPAADLAAYLRHVGADVVVSYDANGGYGHPDHVHLHEVVRAAAADTGIPMLEVVPPDRAAPPSTEPTEWLDLSYRLPEVVAALRAHASQLGVEGAQVVHVGGQREQVVTRSGLRRTPS